MKFIKKKSDPKKPDGLPKDVKKKSESALADLLEEELAKKPEDIQSIHPEDIIVEEDEAAAQPPPEPGKKKKKEKKKKEKEKKKKEKKKGAEGSAKGKLVAAGIVGVLLAGAAVVAVVYVFGDKGANASVTRRFKPPAKQPAKPVQQAAVAPASPAARAPATAEAAQGEPAKSDGTAQPAPAGEAPPAEAAETADAKEAAPDKAAEPEKKAPPESKESPAPIQMPDVDMAAKAGKGDDTFTDRDGGWGWWERCDERLRKKKLPEAAYACQQGLSVAKNDKIKGALLFHLGRIAENAENYDNARDFYAKSIEVHPGNKAAKRKIALLKKDKYNK